MVAMQLWREILTVIKPLRSACARKSTFLNLTLVIMAMCALPDGMGVTSFVRCTFLKPRMYKRLLGLFNGSGVNLDALRSAWARIVRRNFSPVTTASGRVVFVVDGTDLAKSGRKMPGVHLLHNHSDTKLLPDFYMGHSFQAVSVLANSGDECISVPLSVAMDDGIVFSNRDKRTKIDHAVNAFWKVRQHFLQKAVFLADSAYGAGRVVSALDERGDVLVTRCKKNVTAYEPALPPETRGRGRPKKYGTKVKLVKMFENEASFATVASPVYGETNIDVRVYEKVLLWRSAGGRPIKFVCCIHPERGSVILMTTDLEMSASEVISLYGLRFKIEVAFKVSKRVIGAFSYRFWQKGMDRLTRKSGCQYLHMKSDDYRRITKAKVHAYHLFVQLGCVAHGVLQYLSLYRPSNVWGGFRSWLRTMRPQSRPSEQVVAMALSASLPEFLQHAEEADEIGNNLLENVDWNRLSVSSGEQRLCA